MHPANCFYGDELFLLCFMFMLIGAGITLAFMVLVNTPDNDKYK